MATITISKVTARVRLNDGLDAQGNQQYVNVSLPGIYESAWSADRQTSGDKLIAIVTALAPCLSKSILVVEVTETSSVAASN